LDESPEVSVVVFCLFGGPVELDESPEVSVVVFCLFGGSPTNSRSESASESGDEGPKRSIAVSCPGCLGEELLVTEGAWLVTKVALFPSVEV